MIELCGVAFSYGDRDVVTDVDLAIEAGALVVIVGPNGAGKSTLLRLIAGLLAPTRGTAAVFSREPSQVARAELAKRLAFVPQSYQLAFPFTVSDVVLMGRYPHGRRGLFGFQDKSDIAEAQRAMQRCDVTDFSTRRFDSLSGGEQRRVLLAQAFCQNAELILLDEPTASLDPAHALSVFRALSAERDADNATAIVVTHDLNLAVRFADRIVVLDNGAIVADGEPRDVLQSPATASAFSVELHVGALPGSDIAFAVPR